MKTALRLVLGILLVAGVVGGSASPAAAKNACKAACKTALRACLQDATATFKTARTGCLALPTPDEKRTCMAAARGAKATSRAACKATKKSCFTGCGGTGGGGGNGATCTGTREADWVATVNLYRQLAGVGSVTENPAWAIGTQSHATYTTREDTVGHTEDPASPNYTAEGATAAANSNVAGHSSPDQNFGWAIDTWMSGPFHALGIIDPRLTQSSFGIAHDNIGGVQTGAVLDVLRGLTGDASLVIFPVVYPVDGSVLPLGRFEGNELPDPLTSCPGYTAPTGPPLIVQFGSFVPTPAIGGTSLMRDGSPVEHCVFDGNTYANPDASQQSLARSVLSGRAAVVILPREPLKKGSTYAVSLTADGQPLSWSFQHGCP